MDRQPVLAHASGSAAIDRAVTSISEIGDVDVIVLAAPVGQNLQLLADIGAGLQARSARGAPSDPSLVVTDVGGAKRAIVEAAAALPSAAAFVGGHPLGGAERGGFGFARPDLFKGRPWVFTPGAGTPRAVLDTLFAFVHGLGARPVVLEAGEHDRLMAYLSHLPQLATSALMEVVGAAVSAEGLRLAGRGLVDSTRLASSPASVWLDICAANADAIGPALDALITRLSALRDDLARGDGIEAAFDEAGRWRAELLKGHD